MAGQETAKRLYDTFGYETAIQVANEMFQRDKQWIEKLVDDYPNDWKLSDINKSIKMYGELAELLYNLHINNK